jgi:large repetitive protein
MKRAILAAASAATVVLALLPAAAARALVPGGYAVTPMALGTRAFGIAEDPSTGLVYVGGYGTTVGQGAVTVIDGASRTVEESIAVPGTPSNIAVNPATDMVYASSTSGLSVINGADGTLITTMPAGGPVAVDPANGMVYTLTTLENNVPAIAVINGATNTITATIPVPTTTGVLSLAVDSATDTVYAGTRGGALYAIDEATDTVSDPAQLSARGPITSLAIDSADGTVYAVDDGTNAVDVINASTLATVTSITGCPYHVVAAAADPTADVIFVTSYGTQTPSPADSTCVINGATNTVAETFPRGGTAVAADPTTGVAYIAGWYPDTDLWIAKPSAADELSPVVYGFPAESASTTFAVGISTSVPLMVSALPAATLTEKGALPTGLTMSPAGVFSGQPAAGTVGTYPITMTASNGVSPDTTVWLNIVVDIAPTITSPANATFQTGVAGSFTVQATGNPAPTVSAVDYPSWMTFTQVNSTGVLAGTPPAGSGGSQSVYVWAENGSGFTARQVITLTVNQPPAITADSRLTFRAGRHVRYLITSTGFPTPVLSEHGTLPRGLSFRPGPDGTAVIAGKPALSDRGKQYLVAITAGNNIGGAVTKKLTIRIR